MTYKPPQADSPESYDHECTLQSCHSAVVAPLSKVGLFSVLSVFSNKKLHLGSHPLASSDNRVTVLSVFCAQNIFFRLKCVGPIIVDQAMEGRWSHIFRVVPGHFYCTRGPSLVELTGMITVLQVLLLRNTNVFQRVCATITCI